MKTSSMVVTETPKPSIPRGVLSISNRLNRVGKEGAEDAGRMKESSAPMSVTCSASGMKDFTSCSTRAESHDLFLATVR